MLFDFYRCPWDQFRPATVHFCEQQVCSWVVRPAETWSNIGFVLVGLWVLQLSAKESNGHLRGIGYIGIVLGLFSAAFHATGTFWGEFLDVSSMYLFAGLGLAYNLRRWLGWRERTMWIFYLVLICVAMIQLALLKVTGIATFGILFACAAILELRMYLKHKVKANYTHFAAMAVTFLTAWIVWWLDILHLVCDPNNHWFNGHAFWHLACALNFYFVYRFYTQFDHLRPQ